MTIQELLDNINALGIGVGSDAEDVLEKDLATDVRLPALINQGVADLFRVRPARGVVTIDLKASGVVQSDGMVDVFNCLPTDGTARTRFDRLDAYSIASEDMRAFGITANAWTSDRYIRVNKHAVDRADEANITITYRMKPATYTVNEIGTAEDTVIDLDEGLCDLLPLFVASKLYLEEDPGKANQYRSEYEARRNEILAREYNHPEASRFVLTNGW